MKIKNVGRWVLAVVALLIIWFLFIGNQSLFQLYRGHLNIKSQQQALIQLHGKVDSLNRQIDLLQHDTLYVEKIAREELGMAGKNETVYKFIKEKPQP
jgi:cell division protein FtsB